MGIRETMRRRRDESGKAIGSNVTYVGPQVGWKHQYVYVAPDSMALQFVPIHQDGITTFHGINAKAECQQCPWHNSPEPACQCGFNAWHDRWATELIRFKSQHETNDPNRRGLRALLRVNLHGEIIAKTYNLGESGARAYRASHQQVVEASFDPRCYQCGDDATLLVAIGIDYAFGRILRPACQYHAKTKPLAYASLYELAEANNIAMHWQTS